MPTNATGMITRNDSTTFVQESAHDRPFGSCNTTDGRVAGKGGTTHKSTVSTAGNKAALIDSKTVQFQERSDHDLQAASEGLMHELFQGWRDEDVDDSGMEV